MKKSVKLLLIGAQGVGKTSFVESLKGLPYLDRTFAPNIDKSSMTDINLIQYGNQKINIWNCTDNGCVLEPKSNESIIVDTDYIIIMIDHRINYSNYINLVYRKITEANGKRIPYMVVINKSDLFTYPSAECRSISSTLEYLRRNKIPYTFISNKSRTNIFTPLSTLLQGSR